MRNGTMRREPHPPAPPQHPPPVGAGLARRAGFQSGPVKIAVTRQPIRPVSDRRKAQNRVRAAMADQLWPDRREGTVMCGCGRPECHRRADDLNEILRRGRGGSITDEANVVPLSRHCHDEVTFAPESELAWAYAAGILRQAGMRTLEVSRDCARAPGRRGTPAAGRGSRWT